MHQLLHAFLAAGADTSMNGVARPLLVGIGSPHGDDQAGWLLIEQLTPLVSAGARLRTATVPHNLMDWMDGCDSLHIIDASESGETVLRVELGDEDSVDCINALTRCQSSHHFGIGNVIQLGQALGKMPSHIVVWAIPGRNFGPGQPVSDLCRQQVESCADMIAQELASASPGSVQSLP